MERFTELPKDVPKMCQKCAKNVTKMCQKCAKNVPKMCSKCAKIRNLCLFFTKKSPATWSIDKIIPVSIAFLERAICKIVLFR